MVCFKNHQWLEFSNGLASNPYDKLKVSDFFKDADICEDSFTNDDKGINDGGAAMMAYAKMQFEDIAPKEREELQQNLLRYCELDTLAMIMIYEAWVNWLK